MNEVQHADPGRPCSGRKATRTRTVPSLKSNNLKNEQTANQLDIANKLYTSNYGLNSNSHLELVANKCKALSAGQSCNLNPINSQPISSTLTEAKTIYGLRQTLKDILETRAKTDSNEVSLNRHRKELVRVWSKERVTVTETRIYSRPPSLNNSRCQSGYGSSLADVNDESGRSRKSAENIPRRVSITVSSENVSKPPISPTRKYTETNIDGVVEQPKPRSIPINILSLEGTSSVSGPSPIIKRPKAINFMQSQKEGRRSSEASEKRVSIREDQEVIEDRYSRPNTGYFNQEERFVEDDEKPTEKYQEKFAQHPSVYESFKPIQTSTPLLEGDQLEEEQYNNTSYQSYGEEFVYGQRITPRNENYASESYYRSDIDPTNAGLFQCKSSLNNNRLNSIDEMSQMIPINLEDKLDYTIDASQTISSVTDPNSSTSSVYTTAKSSPFPTNPPTPVEHLGQFYPVEGLIPERLKCSANNPTKSAVEYDQMKNFYTSSQYYSIRDFNEPDRMVQQSVHFRTIVRKDQTGYGFTVCGSQPVTVRTIRTGGTAEKAGIRPGDEIIKVNGIYVENLDHSEVVSKIKSKHNVCFMLRRNRLIRESELFRQNQIKANNAKNQDYQSINLSSTQSISEEDISDRRQKHQLRRRRAREARMKNLSNRDNKDTDSQTTADFESISNDPSTADNSIAEDDMTLADYDDDGNSTNYDISDIETEDLPRVS